MFCVIHNPLTLDQLKYNTMIEFETQNDLDSTEIQLDEKQIFNVDSCDESVEIGTQYTLHADCDEEKVVIEDTERSGFSYIMESQDIDIQTNCEEYLSNLLQSEFEYVLSLLSSVTDSNHIELIDTVNTIEYFEIVIRDTLYDSKILIKANTF